MREQREIIYAQRYDVITADRDLAPEIHAMIRRTIGRIVDGHARSKQDEKLEAILNFAKYNLLPEDSITMEDLSGLSDKAIKKSSSNVPCKFTIVRFQNYAMKKQLKNSKKS